MMMTGRWIQGALVFGMKDMLEPSTTDDAS